MGEAVVLETKLNAYASTSVANSTFEYRTRVSLE
jgi:hypothetical protein